MDETKNDLQLFAELYDVQPQAIVWMRPLWNENKSNITDFEYAYANNEGLKYLNLTEEQFAGLLLSNSPTLTNEMRLQVLEEMRTVYITGEKSETSIYNPALHKYARVLRTKLRHGILTVVQDITRENVIIKQLQAQSVQLQEQKALVDNILKSSSNAISVGEMIRDENAQIIDIKTIIANQAAEKFTGIPLETYLSKTAGALDPSFISSPYFRLCVNCMETGEPFITQYFLESVGRWMEVSVSKMDEQHQIYIFTDVTTIKEAQLALERSAAQLQTIINRTQSGILTATPVKDETGAVVDFRFVVANKALAAYLHQEPEALIGELGSKWFTGYKTNGLFEMFYDTYVNNTINRFDFHYLADGIDAWIDLMCTRFDNEILVTFTDYTPVKKLQLELQSSVEELKRSNRYLEDFAHAASHDMKEPLRKIRTFLDRLKGRLGARLEEIERQLFERVEASAERMQLLVDDLLEFSYVSERPQVLETVDLHDEIQKVLFDFDVLIEEKQANVTIEPLPIVNGNTRQLHQLFHNLIGNALKYSKPGQPAVVTIQSRQIKGTDLPEKVPVEQSEMLFHLIEVSDNGIGFEPQYAEQIFAMFQRLHGKAEYAGTGVGLSIARKVVENHNGLIWATSEPRKGAVFYVLLPA
jgi:signal transduction histidine kinase